MNYFATLFDSNYLSRGLALLSSLKKNCSAKFTLFIIPLDDDVTNYFIGKNISEVILISLDEIEDYYPELKKIKKDRSVVEYYFTLSPYLPLYILKNFQFVKQITTLDADIFFFDDPGIIFNTYSEASILITPHNFNGDLKDLEIFGKFNVSFQSFKRDENALKCLELWRKQCFDWCFDYFDKKEDRFADQKYLDTWEKQFASVSVILISGAGVAPWNLNKHSISKNRSAITIDNSPLIYFHFHGLRLLGRYFAFSNIERYGGSDKSRSVQQLYHIYLKVLLSVSKSLKNYDGLITRNSMPKQGLLKSLLKTNGYWFYSKFFIAYINVYPILKKINNRLNLKWPG